MGNKVSIKSEYWKEIKPGGEIEKKYISLGEYIPKKLEIDIEPRVVFNLVEIIKFIYQRKAFLFLY